jgi:plasmid stabilization system protein ParE
VRIEWTASASDDLVRLHRFLAAVAPDAAAKAVQSLARAPQRLVEFPRIGERLEAYSPREVRRISVGRYELRYELTENRIIVLRLWHGRENRSTLPDDGD